MDGFCRLTNGRAVEVCGHFAIGDHSLEKKNSLCIPPSFCITIILLFILVIFPCHRFQTEFKVFSDTHQSLEHGSIREINHHQLAELKTSIGVNCRPWRYHSDSLGVAEILVCLPSFPFDFLILVQHSR